MEATDKTSSSSRGVRYEYEPLNSKVTFRILELLPGNEDDPVSYRLHAANWDPPPPYEAISYAWGDVNDTTLSFCHDLPLFITRSLKDGLVAMRFKDRSRLLWADAICIDQSNYAERGHQVSQMRLIYEKATNVLVWLGSDVDERAGKAMHMMNAIADDSTKKATGNAHEGKAGLRKVDELWDVLPQRMLKGPLYSNTDNWRTLAWFFSRPWFNRLWVIQEVNSNPNVEVLCGGNQISWDVVALGASYIERHPKIYLFYDFPASYYRNAYYMRRRLWFREVTLPSLLNWGRSFRATDPLDRVYALMGMPTFSKMSDPLRVDYSITPVELGQRVAVRCIKDMQSLRILYYAQHFREGEKFPSWIPRWDREEQYRPINDTLKKVRWKASGDFKPEFSFGKGTLKLDGAEFDVIKSCVPLGECSWLDDESMSDHPILKFLETHSMDSAYPTGCKSLDAFSVSLTTGLGVNLRKASEDMVSFEANFAAYLNYLLHQTGCVRCITSTLKARAKLGDSFEYESLVRKKGRNRSLFSTEGGFIGLGPPHCNPGDRVCILFGGEVPFVLRPVGGCYQLVGDAYVHGIMEGEALNMPGFKGTKGCFEIV